MQNCQSEVGEIFLCNNPDVPHIRALLGSDDKECIALFFDDFVAIAFDVGTLSNVHTYWYDAFSEEVEGRMGVECRRRRAMDSRRMDKGQIQD